MNFILFQNSYPETSGLYTRQQNLSPSYKKTLNKDQLSEKDAVESFWLYNVHIVKGRGGEMASYYRVLYRGVESRLISHSAAVIEAMLPLP